MPFQLLKVSASANVDVLYPNYSILITHQVPLDSIASHSGAKSGDYLVKIGGDSNSNPVLGKILKSTSITIRRRYLYEMLVLRP